MQLSARQFDLFNGDADGICALIQLRLAEPKQTELVTGVKRDIKLLKKLTVETGDQITVLDISMDKNKAELETALAKGANVFYCDHHFAGDIPQHENLTALIDTSADTCTALLINHYLNGKYVNWAITAAFGDNLIQVAQALAESVGLTQTQTEQLKLLGIAINYNGYGANEQDLHIHPAELFRLLVAFADPLTLIEQQAKIYQQLIANYQADMDKAQNAKLIHQSQAGKVFLLPNQPWARRVSGVWGNDLANQAPELAHAVLTELSDSGYLVSVRAPKQRASGADELCMKFETGGGRKAAAGINQLADNELQRFFAEFDQQFTV
ncbi:DHH family phosphoesterase [Catenovulum sp. 2E275]|uniref:DHH family phosphoesterase n=1 Tax=Catenovulum sp. 2E275 TaxID=2980497 RepID=UPI0021D067F4|nr:DHH family phosphoesterase [Catenovulum sp. 2E275]MCU4675580.1 DHH family phosphoesterase [Catenovulum sp. 2E275]